MIDETFLRFIDVASERAVPAKDSPARQWKTTNNLGSWAISAVRVSRSWDLFSQKNYIHTCKLFFPYKNSGPSYRD